MEFPRLVLFLAFATFAFFGVTFLIMPQAMAAVVDIHPISSTAQSDVMAVYGGLELAIAGVLGRSLTQRGRTKAGLWLAAILFAGLGGGRLVGVALHSPVSAVTLRVLCAEWVAAIGCAFAWWAQVTRERPVPGHHEDNDPPAEIPVP